MRLGLLLFLLSVAASIAAPVSAALAATTGAVTGPYWHRSAALHYTVEADGRWSVDEIWELRADTNAVAQTIAQQSYTYVPSLQRVELLAAFTRKADGRVIPVAPGALFDQAVAAAATTPQFDGRVGRSIVFPQVRAGDVVHYALRRTALAPVFPGEAVLSANAGSAQTTEAAEITVAMPPGRTLQVATSGLIEQAPEGGARRWTLAPRAAGPVALEGSTIGSYEALGRAYAQGAATAAAPGPAIRARADALAPAGLDERETVRRLYGFVAGEIRYVANLLGSGHLVPRPAETVLAEGWGDCKDHAALLAALLAAKGIESSPALISLRRRYDLPPVPGLSALNHVITYVPSLDLYLDSTAPYAAFGELAPGEYDKPVVIADAASPRLAHTPRMPAGAVDLSTWTEVSIDKAGGIAGRTVTSAAGPWAMTLRETAAWFERNGGAQAASTRLHSLGTPGRGEFTFDTPDAAPGPFRVEGRFAVQDRLAGAGTVPFVIPAGLGVLSPSGTALVEQAVTEDGRHACYPGRETEEIEVRPSREMRIGPVPKDVSVVAGGARFTARYADADGVLLVHRAFELVTDHQGCTLEEFERMRPALAAALLDARQARIGLVAMPDGRRAGRRTLFGQGSRGRTGLALGSRRGSAGPDDRAGLDDGMDAGLLGRP